MTAFSSIAKTEYAKELQRDFEQAQKTARSNQGWDTMFRIGLLFLGLAIVGCSGIATSELIENPRPWSLVSTILAGISAALSGFAFAEFSFSKRQRIWEKKATLLRSLRDELRFSDPDEQSFRKRVDEVQLLGDYSDPGA
ncbi:MAG TPA: hypothetical protein VNA69_19970 [Thermoanaerobaculia bacterium]|nr:hypothetical protein [Thermoanaerobaculia bacterium]